MLLAHVERHSYIDATYLGCSILHLCWLLIFGSGTHGLPQQRSSPVTLIYPSMSAARIAGSTIHPCTLSGTHTSMQLARLASNISESWYYHSHYRNYGSHAVFLAAPTGNSTHTLMQHCWAADSSSHAASTARLPHIRKLVLYMVTTTTMAHMPYL